MTLLTRIGLVAVVAVTLVPFTVADDQGCGFNEFWYGDQSCCVPKGGISNPPSPPQGKDCPHDGNWYWHPNERCCVPKHPHFSNPGCDNNWNWDKKDNCCKPPPPSHSQCNGGEFWWDDGNCCLPNGGPTFPHSPPPGKDCPHHGWYWHGGKGCCVPHHRSPPRPQCDNGWSWDGGNKCCKPHHPKPSGRSHYQSKRDIKSRAVTLCPVGLEACPIAGLLGGDYECIDTKVELESCGGCSSIGEGQDCTAIEGVWNVGCEHGTCAVYTCAAGYRRAPDGKSCIAL